jgi:hypothetical protein
VALRGARGVVHRRSGGLDLPVHLGELPLHPLEVRDGLVELLALLCVLQRVLQPRGRPRRRADGTAEALPVQGDELLFERVTPAGEDVALRDGDVVDLEVRLAVARHVVVLLFDLDPGIVDGQDDRAEPLRELHPRHGGVGKGDPPDPHLLAVAHQLAALLLHRRVHRRDVRAGVRLRHRDGDVALARGDVGEVLLFHFL